MRSTASTEAPAVEAPRPGRGIRLFVAAFLGFFLLTGLIGVEAWPATGWGLYSNLRHGRHWSWQVAAVDGAGQERLINFRQLAIAYHGVPSRLNDLAELSDEGRRSTCLAFVAAARAQGTVTDRIRVYRVRIQVPKGPGRPVPPPDRVDQYYECVLPS